MSNTEKNKHMTLNNRNEIEECLAKGMTFKAIAKRIGKNPTTVSRELKAHIQPHTNGFVKTDATCPKLLKPPFVCNGCDKRSKSSCPYPRRLYIAKKAHAEYETLLSEAREGIPLNKPSFYETERIISNAVRNGQHVYHAIQANHLPVSVSTVYRYIKKGYYSISPLSLPRMVKFKPRHSKDIAFVPRAIRHNRTYSDFLAYVEDHPGIPVTQLDTVIGRIGGKVILTIHFVNPDFMIGLLLENRTAAETASKITDLKARLKARGFNFSDLIPLILTDNGGEFSIVSAFENDEDEQQATRMFFCDPNTSYQKPQIEKNHSLFRDIVPAGSSFDLFTQDTVDLIFSHVNAVMRKQFNGKSAYDLFTFTHSTDLADALGIRFIPPDQVVQSPRLLRTSCSF
ncbi:MAG: IS30 family transposase [Clostridiales bacterium]|nr:IS30 family transposase [Clostridiales bacterium]